MKKPSEPADSAADLRAKVIGLGATSARKSYYPQLRARLDELERFRALLDQSNDAILLVELPRQRISDLNRTACGLLQVEHAAAIGEPLDRFFPGVEVPDDGSGLPDQNEAHDLLRTKLRGAAGGSTWVEMSLDVVELRQRRYAVAVARDIGQQVAAERALRQSEQRFRAVFEGSALGLAVLDASGTVLQANPEMLAMIGQTGGTAVGLSCASLIHPDDLPRFEAWFAGLRAGERERLRTEARCLARGGREVSVRITASPVASGAHPQAVVTMEDITSRKLVEQERQRLYEEVQRASRLKDEFLAVVSHELRTPLTPILGWTEMLASGRLDQQRQAHALGVIGRSARKLSLFIEDLLDISSFLAGKVRLERKPVGLGPLVEATVGALRPAAEDKGLDLELELPPEPELRVLADARRLEQVLANLLSNALKFTPQGGHVVVRLRASGQHARLEVEDDGEGIAAEALPLVFEHFWQADTSHTRQSGGMGIGLALVREIVRHHDGTVEAISPGKDRGTRVSVELPLLGREQAFAPPTPRPGMGPDRPLGGVEVLIVDDDEDTVELLAAVLRHAGARVRTATSAAEALSALEQRPPALLLSDIAMPDQDGYALARQVLSRGAPPTLVALTALARGEDHSRALAAGFRAVLVKPIGPAELISALCELTA